MVGYAIVMVQILALGLSTAFEGHTWTAISALGVVLVLGGNVIVLTKGRRAKHVEEATAA